MAWKQSCERNRRLLKLNRQMGYPFLYSVYDSDKSRYCRHYFGCRYLKNLSNRRVRRYRGEIPGHNGYRKVYEYWWQIT